VSDNYPEVTVLVLSYNCSDKVRRCLASLSQLNYDHFTVVVIDNNSIDEVASIVRDEFAGVLFIQAGSNRGYTGGNNLGIKYALANSADYVLVLNPDTIVADPDFLRELVDYSESNPRVGVSGPRVFFQTKDRVQNTVLFAPGFWRSIINWVRYRLAPERFQLSKADVLEAEVLNGVCVLLRAACLREIGLFDENVFMYIEDADMDHRARQSGWSVRYLPIDGVIHEQKASGYHMTSLVSFLLRRNSVYYLCKIGKRFDAVAYAVFSLGVLAIRALMKFRWYSFKKYAHFCKRLTAAYYQILFGKRYDNSFGPPFI
jgi:GT2 family glycosyltransferase